MSTAVRLANSIDRRTGALLAALVVAFISAFVALPSAMAQQYNDPPGRVGRLARLQGTVSFHTADQQQWDAATLNYPVTNGSAVWTEPNSRAAVQIGYNSIELDSETELNVAQLDDNVFAATIGQGAVYVILRSIEQGETYIIDTPRGRVTFDRPGRYEIIAGDQGRSTEVIVFDGYARVSGDNLNVPVERGSRLLIDGNYPQVRTAVSGIGQPDRFAAWVLANVRDPAAPPPQTVQGMTGVQDLGNYGRWDSTPEYGQVWYPTVQAGWQPYREGRWVWVEPWGWTWVAAEPWGFAPFHYGRWVEVRGRWAWTPIVIVLGGGHHHRHIYAPALVTFFGNFGGYGGGPVGWVPLAPYEPYRPYYRTSPRYVQNINIVYVKNVTNITVYNERDHRLDQYANRRSFTAVDADVMRGSKPVQSSLKPVNERDVSNWRVAHVDNDVKPSHDTIGVTPGVARKFNIDDSDKRGRNNSPGPKIEAAKGQADKFPQFQDDKSKGGSNNNGPNNGKGGFSPNANIVPNNGPNGTGPAGNNPTGNEDRRFKGPRTPGSPVQPNGSATITPNKPIDDTNKGKGGPSNVGPVNNGNPNTGNGNPNAGKTNNGPTNNDPATFRKNDKVDKTPGAPLGGSGGGKGNAGPTIDNSNKGAVNNVAPITNNDGNKNKGTHNDPGNARIVTPPNTNSGGGGGNDHKGGNNVQKVDPPKVQADPPKKADPPKRDKDKDDDTNNGKRR